MLTDGEETCGGAPCELGKSLKATATGQLTVHVIGYQLRGFSWTGAQSILDVKCLAEETGGLYITAENRRGSGEGVREDARLPHDVGRRRRCCAKREVRAVGGTPRRT